MKISLVIASGLCLAIGTACSKGSSGGSAGAPSAAAATAPDPCTFHHKNPGFCLVVPPPYGSMGEKAMSIDTRVNFNHGPDTGMVFLVKWSTPANPARDETMTKQFQETESKDGTVFNDDGKGGYWYDAVKKAGSTTYHQIGSSVKGPAGRIECEADGVNDEAQAKAFVAICRSLRVE